ncbi:MAG: carbamoyltransferase HypF [Rhodospirillales bacterium]|nr:carbamoyltransferase HypF [Rhodospirillales bacterium]
MADAFVVPLPRSVAPVVAVGAFLKNTLCLAQGSASLVSNDLGDLSTASARGAAERTFAAFLDSVDGWPPIIAHDRHPDFPSTRFAEDMAGRLGVPAVAVQHHHAHVAAVMAEHGLEQPVLGLALDGYGYGDDGEAWGGELLRVDASGFRRLGHLKHLRQPGGDAAARQPWRMGAAALHALGRGPEIPARFAAFPGAGVVARMLERGCNAPPTSSCGRLFDAACGLLGVKAVSAFEGEAPMALERLAASVAQGEAEAAAEVDSGGWRLDDGTLGWRLDDESLGWRLDDESLGWRLDDESLGWRLDDGSLGWRLDGGVLDMTPLLARLIGMDPRQGARLFHATLVAALAEWVATTAAATGVRRVVLAGGCFANTVLRTGLTMALAERDLETLSPRGLGPGDAAISLGQAWVVAMAEHRRKKD